jgi:N-acetylglucosamine-6-phosphate deacetylase
LFDVQINGALGISFNAADLTAAQVGQVVERCQQHGISNFCPTLITAAFAALEHGFATLAQARAIKPLLAQVIPGFHLEGPWISAEDGPRGAHPRAHVRLPGWDEFRRLQDAARGGIVLVTLAPELDGVLPFIERLVAANVVVSLGHTAATGEQISAAVQAGARLATHLGNGCHALLPRHDNPIWHQLAEDALAASLICDGHHLPPAVMRCLIRAKTPARTILTCDASSLAGLPPGRYRAWSTDLEILPSGKIILANTGYLAGSSLFTDACLTEVLRHADVSLREAIDMATVNPRRLLGQPAVDLVPGAPADLMLFDWKPGESVQVRATLVAGQIVWRVP